MSWLRRIFGGADPRLAPAASGRVTLPRRSERIVVVAELDFVGERISSPDGRFTLLWRDRHWAYGEPVAGRYLLIDGETVLVDQGMERPQDGKVADGGNFILNDWGDSDALSGTFRAFRSDGSVILARSYSANLLNNGLSDDGRLAVCQTAKRRARRTARC